MHRIGIVQKKGNWLPHDLTERAIERRKAMCKILLKRYKMKGFLHRIVNGDKKWILHNNPKRQKVWVHSGEATSSKSKANIHGSNLMVGLGGCQILRGPETVRNHHF